MGAIRLRETAPSIDPTAAIEALDPDQASSRPGPRVLRVATGVDAGGAADRPLYLTDALRRRGVDTRLVGGPTIDGALALAPWRDVPTTGTPWLMDGLHLGADVRALRELVGTMRRWHPDVVHTHLVKAGTLGRLAATRTRVPVLVHSFHEYGLERYVASLRNAAFAATERALARRTDALVAGSWRVRDELVEHGIGSARRWHVLPEGPAAVAALASLYRALVASRALRHG
jgi:hypothetical protein